ncbi:MAG: hypothetical protein C5B43_01280 [Verrucomicrobia bacterium]|nr:MAG: hypothetical protein C5B43_01280 [Verrucomicrobiota bacterium]
MKIHEYTVREEEIIAFKKKRYANVLLNRAVSKGELERPSHCQNCKNRAAIQGHHHDYGKPYDVTWLCSKCHAKAHAPDHPLNPKNCKQTPMPSIYDQYNRVMISFNLPTEEFIALQREADIQKKTVSQVMQELISKNYPIQKNQLEINLEESNHDNTQSVIHKGIQGIQEDEGRMLQLECAQLQKIRSEGNTSLHRVDGIVFELFARHGKHAEPLQRNFVNR